MEQYYLAWDLAILDIFATKEWDPHPSIDFVVPTASNSGRTPRMATELLWGSQ